MHRRGAIAVDIADAGLCEALPSGNDARSAAGTVAVQLPSLATLAV
ncbi:hypothetical protein HT118_19365 [Escherichia coli]|nr:hypothetical protein [Escherichia coli]